jgi:hypothetical protein
MRSIDDILSEAYATFVTYSGTNMTDADPNDCSAGNGTSEAISELLNSKPLRELSDLDFCDYHHLAVQHVGNANNYRHFLPRLLELIAKGKLDGSTLLDKLASAEAASWPIGERRIIRDFFRACPSAIDGTSTPEQVQDTLGLPWVDAPN